MKKLSYIALMVTLMMGLQFSAQANSFIETVDGPSTTIPNGNAGAEYNSSEQVIVIDMATAGDQERVFITVKNSRGQEVAREFIMVDGKGAQTQIEMRGAREGVYTVQVSSVTIKFTKKLEVN